VGVTTRGAQPPDTAGGIAWAPHVADTPLEPLAPLDALELAPLELAPLELAPLDVEPLEVPPPAPEEHPAKNVVSPATNAPSASVRERDIRRR